MDCIPRWAEDDFDFRGQTEETCFQRAILHIGGTNAAKGGRDEEIVFQFVRNKLTINRNRKHYNCPVFIYPA